MNQLRSILVMLLCGILCATACAQDNVGIKYFGLSIHPKGQKDNAHLMPNRLDKKGYFVLNLGAVVSYEKFVFHDVISVKAVQALYADCATRLGGFSHIGVRLKIFEAGRHSLYGGIGPTMVYRRNWMKLDGYINPNQFKGGSSDTWQTLFLWYGGEFEYKYALSDRFECATSFIPGYPDLMSLSVGIHFKRKN